MTAGESPRLAGRESRPPSSVSVLAVTSYRPAELLDPLAATDLDVSVLELDDSAGPLARALSAARRTRRALGRHDPDLLLLDCFETLGAPAALVADRHDVPVVARLVGDPWRKLEEERLAPARADRDIPRYLRHRLSHGLNGVVFERASGFVTVSTDLARVAARRTGCPPERIGVVPVPVTTDTTSGSAAAARAALAIDAERVLLTVTNLKFRAKLAGVERVLEAVEPLLSADPDLAYVVAGGGEYHADLRDAIAAIDDPAVRRRVHAPGHVDSVADLYALADVFVYVSDLDGYPNVVLEAQTAGVPVVASDACGMRDQITDGETGFLVAPDAPGELAARLDRLLSTPDERRRLGEAGRRRARRENDPEAVGDRLSAFLAGLAADLDGE
ncbi:glycosyltransferase family 4 protein [Natronomonas marina]|jgi:glycosyltransferase involved in cell wall biosynthesis|uniref:glycosyltransferase family 4 protein n=1 Tax=Natronomonas marina TaxID=2961939 RepID=UPI0020C98D0A|nr:glycosyltransferase family 4 protein [Natronomonas marina]